MEQPNNPGIVVSPMGVGEIIDAGFNLTRRRYKRLILIGAWGLIPAGVAGVLSSVMTGDSFDMQLSPLLIPQLLLALANLVMTLLAYSAVAIACARIIDPDAQADDLEPGPLYRAALGRFWAQVGWGLIIVLMWIPLIIVFPLGIYLYVRWFLSWAAILVERQGPIASLKRSWALTRRAWWHTFGVLLVASIILGIVALVIVGVLMALGAAAGFLAGSAVVTQVMTSIAGTIGSLALTPLYVVYYVILYFELRARNEGYDLSQRARQSTPM